MAVPQYPLAENIVNSTVTATGNTAFTLRSADSLAIIVSSGAGTGTTPTLDVAVQTSPDGGGSTGTWITVERFTQITTSAAAETISFKPYLGVGDAATAFVSAATGGQAKQNVVCAKDMRILYTVGGTGPSFALKVWAVWQGGQSNRSGF